MKYRRLSDYKIKKIMECFCNDLTASTSAMSLNRKTVNAYFKELGEFELDESYFGARRIRGERGRGAAGKTPVFGLLKRNGKVFVTVVKNCSKESLMSIIQGKILEGSTIHTDGLTITESTTVPMNLLVEKAMLTVLNAFGVLQKEGWLNSMVYHQIRLCYT